MNIRFSIFFIAAIALCAAVFNVSSASETDGTIVTGGAAGFAWSNKSGWVNFGLSGGNIHVTDLGLTGNAWSANAGWINLAPSNGGVTNNDGTLSGYAWGAGLGWINFSGVTIDNSGRFHGIATGDLVGSLTFNCDNCNVTTDWRPLAARTGTPTPPAPPSGGSGGSSNNVLVPPTAPTSTPSAQGPLQISEIDPVKDGVFNIIDFNLLMVNWSPLGQGNPADMNRDGAVNILDFNLLMVNWGLTYLTQ